jgi:hypothetical protein
VAQVSPLRPGIHVRYEAYFCDARRDGQSGRSHIADPSVAPNSSTPTSAFTTYAPGAPGLDSQTWDHGQAAQVRKVTNEGAPHLAFEMWDSQIHAGRHERQACAWEASRHSTPPHVMEDDLLGGSNACHYVWIFKRRRKPPRMRSSSRTLIDAVASEIATHLSAKILASILSHLRCSRALHRKHESNVIQCAEDS